MHYESCIWRRNVVGKVLQTVIRFPPRTCTMLYLIGYAYGLLSSPHMRQTLSAVECNLKQLMAAYLSSRDCEKYWFLLRDVVRQLLPGIYFLESRFRVVLSSRSVKLFVYYLSVLQNTHARQNFGVVVKSFESRRQYACARNTNNCRNLQLNNTYFAHLYLVVPWGTLSQDVISEECG